jgi:hypothetical protein
VEILSLLHFGNDEASKHVKRISVGLNRFDLFSVVNLNLKESIVIDAENFCCLFLTISGQNSNG